MKDLRLVVPEFDYKRKYGLSLAGLVDLLVKAGYILNSVKSIKDIQVQFKSVGKQDINDSKINILLDELASKCIYSTIVTEKSRRSNLDIIIDLYYGLNGSDAEYISRIILKQFTVDPLYRLHQVHPCALVIYRNQRDLETLSSSLLEIDKKFSREELKDKSKRIQVYKEYGKPKVVSIWH
jgi:hypothetical protein